MKRSNAMKTLLDICKTADSKVNQDTTKSMRFNALLEAIKSNAYDMVKLSDEQKELVDKAVDNLAGPSVAYQAILNKDLMNLPSIKKLGIEHAKQCNKSYLKLIISLVKDPPETLINIAKSDANSTDRAVLNAIPQLLRDSNISKDLITALDEKNSSPAKVEEALKNINIPLEQLKAIRSYIFESKQAECRYQHACVEEYLNSNILQEERQELESLLKAEKAFNEFINDYVEGKDMGRYTKTFTMSRTSDKILLALSGVITAAAIAPAMGGGVALATEINNISGVLSAFETLAATNPALLAGIVLASTLGLATVVMGLLSVGTKSALNEITGADAKPLYAALKEQVPEVASPTVEKA